MELLKIKNYRLYQMPKWQLNRAKKADLIELASKVATDAHERLKNENLTTKHLGQIDIFRMLKRHSQTSVMKPSLIEFIRIMARKLAKLDEAIEKKERAIKAAMAAADALAEKEFAVVQAVRFRVGKDYRATCDECCFGNYDSESPDTMSFWVGSEHKKDPCKICRPGGFFEMGIRLIEIKDGDKCQK